MSFGMLTEAIKYFWGLVLSYICIALSLPPEAAEPEKHQQGPCRLYASALCMGQKSRGFTSSCSAIQPVGILLISICYDEISFGNDKLLGKRANTCHT